MGKSRPFRFKRFTVTQERAAMKVGTDGVLLGAWCTVLPGMQRALDIGTGTGLIALMLAQRGEGLLVDAIEPQEGAYRDAACNISASDWSGRILVHNITLQQFRATEKYDLVVCNPPYFSRSLLPPSADRVTARHDQSLKCEDLVKCAAAVCRDNARFAVVIPTEQAGRYITECDMKGFALDRRTDVRTTLNSPVKRTLLEFVFNPSCAVKATCGELVIESAPLTYTRQYRELTREFYLKF